MVTQNNIQNDSYDREMIPAEIAARRDREGENFKQLPEHDGDGIDTTGGYTMDERGLMNNYAVEPEMYIEEPGDLRKQNEMRTAEKIQRLRNVRNQDSEGLLDDSSDDRTRGPGLF